MSRQRIPVPFERPFTCVDLAAQGLSRAALAGWLERGEVIRLAQGSYAPVWAPDLSRLRRVHTSFNVTRGDRPMSTLGAATHHFICTPPTLPPRHRRTLRARDLVGVPTFDVDGLIVPTRAWTACELARSQPLAGALIPFECLLRNGITQEDLNWLQHRIDQISGWPGTATLSRAWSEASHLSGSPLESYSKGLILDAGLPVPEQQTEFVVDGQRYFVDFFWREFGVVGEADGEMKYDEAGRAQFAQHRRQAALQSRGLTVVRWGWPELTPDPQPWLAGLQRILRH